MAICTTAEYKTWRNISVSSYDALIAQLISGCQGEAERFCGRFFSNASFTERYSGNGGIALQLNAYPITAIDSIAIINSVVTGTTTTTTLVYGVDYVWDIANADNNGQVFRSNAISGRFGRGYAATWPLGDATAAPLAQWGNFPCWPDGDLNILIEYDGGYSTAPDALKLALFHYMDQVWINAWPSGLPNGLSAEKIDQYSYTVGDPDRNAIALKRGMFAQQANLTQYFGAYINKGRAP